MLNKYFYKLLIGVFSIFALGVFVPKNVRAIENPLNFPNNTFGIHILSEADIDDAANLVNSSGGEWGYVTLVIRKDERDTTRWQQVFDELRRKKLIPIVRLATIQTENGWEKPSFDEIDGWVSFLNSLNWVVENRYVIVGNEPNHAIEWGGEINPESYGDYLVEISKKLKTTSGDFFILPAGLDASAPNGEDTMSEATFLQKMVEEKKDLFNFIDGWSSHSYPNPNFSGPVGAEGRGTLKTYEWELEYLKNLGLDKELPVFITETGWAHDMDKNVLGYKSDSLIASYLKKAYMDVWNDSRIVAITPFVLNYSDSPFDIFSWKKKDGNGFYDFYYEIQKLPKPKGEPNQLNIGKIIYVLLPQLTGVTEEAYGIAFMKNVGQAIWEWDNPSEIEVKGEKYEVKPVTPLNNIEPNEEAFAVFRKI